MLVMTVEQLERLGDDATRRYVARLAAFAREQFPHELGGVDRRALEAAVARVRDQAVGWRLDSDRELRMLLVLRFTFGAGYADLPWFRRIVDDPFARKIDRLVDGAKLAA